MKRNITLILALAMTAALLTGCGAKEPAPTTVPTTEAVTEAPTEAAPGTEPTEETSAPITGPSADALAIYQAIWADYAEDEKFPIGGGNPQDFIMDAPGAIDLTKEHNLRNTLLLSEEAVSKLDGAATMLHLMNTNIFTSGLVHFGQDTDLAALAEEMKDTIKGNPFVCGFPERMLLAIVEGDYLLISFGHGEIMDTFQRHLTAVYPDTQVLCTDSII